MKNTKVKPKISEVLHLAADEYLSESGATHGRVERFSCAAVSGAVNHVIESCQLSYGEAEDLENDIFYGLEMMGCDTDAAHLFKKYGDCIEGNPDVQGMRYFWLKWAALMAEEQGQ